MTNFNEVRGVVASVYIQISNRQPQRIRIESDFTDADRTMQRSGRLILRQIPNQRWHSEISPDAVCKKGQNQRARDSPGPRLGPDCHWPALDIGFRSIARGSSEAPSDKHASTFHGLEIQQ